MEQLDISEAVKFLYGYSEYLRKKKDYKFSDQLREIIRRLGYKVTNGATTK